MNNHCIISLLLNIEQNIIQYIDMIFKIVNSKIFKEIKKEDDINIDFNKKYIYI